MLGVDSITEAEELTEFTMEGLEPFRIDEVEEKFCNDCYIKDECAILVFINERLKERCLRQGKRVDKMDNKYRCSFFKENI